MPLNKKPDKPRVFAFFSGPVNILNELRKVNGVSFKEKELLIEYAATKSPAKSIKSSKMETDGFL